MSSKKRCAWVNNNPLYIEYHDKEWGVPVFDEQLLFEFVILEGMQAGLNWLTILKKRNHYRETFDNFNAQLIAKYDEQKFENLMVDEGLIRNRTKMKAIINNAQAFLQIKKDNGNFSNFLWQVVGGQPIHNHWKSHAEVPTQTVHSQQLSTRLKKWGFTFVGSTICYAFMQAVGMVNDHTTDCFRHQELLS